MSTALPLPIYQRVPVGGSTPHSVATPVATPLAAKSDSTSASATVKSLLLHWEDATALDSHQTSALSQLSSALSQRSSSVDVACRRRQLEEEKSEESNPANTKTRPTSILESMAATHAAAPTVHAQTHALFPSSDIATSATANTESIYALLLNTQLYASTPDYIAHLSRVDAGAFSSPHGESDFRVCAPVRRPLPTASIAHIQYYLQLRSTSNFLQRLIDSTSSLLTSSGEMLQHFSIVFDKTNSVREECSALLIEQQTLAAATFKFNYHLSYFTEYEAIQKKMTETDPILKRFMRENSDLHAFTQQSSHTQSGGTSLDPLASNPIHSPEFAHILTSLDQCIDYMRANSDFLDATSARVRYDKLHATVMRNIKHFVRTNLERAIKMGQEQVALPTNTLDVGHTHHANEVATLGVYQLHPSWLRIFVQLRSLAHAIKPLMVEMEHRAFVDEGGIFGAGFTAPAAAAASTAAIATAASGFVDAHGLVVASTQSTFYKDLLLDCYRLYIERRHATLYAGLQKHLTELSQSGRPLSQLIRSSCNGWIELCTVESQLYFEFFSSNQHSITAINEMLNGFCTLLYTMLRPIIIHNLDMDSLAEVITILKGEILDEQIRMRQTKGGSTANTASGPASSSSSSSSSSSAPGRDLFHSSSPLFAFAKSIQRLIADVQERLIYRAQLYIRDTIQKYQHTKEDLAYPDKLRHSLPSPSPDSGSLGGASLDPTSLSASVMPTATSLTSREQLFSTWHPALERTLMCLSKLYRCVEPSVFKYLAQEAVSVCLNILLDASSRITLAHAPHDPASSDGILFLIKHLLIMRDQLSPFTGVDWSVTETDLDFSHMRDVLPNIFSSVGKWSSFIDLVQTSAPRLRENKMDAKKVTTHTLAHARERNNSNNPFKMRVHVDSPSSASPSLPFHLLSCSSLI